MAGNIDTVAIVNADGSRIATVRDTGSNDSLNVAIVDASGNQVTSFGGGTQYTEADTDASITGTAVMWEDSADTLRAASVAKPLPTQISDGTRTATVRDTGASDSLNVAIVDASGNQITSFGGGTEFAEDSAHSTGANGSMILGVRNDSGATTFTDTNGDYSPIAVTSIGGVIVEGAVPTDSPIIGNPLLVGGRAQLSGAAPGVTANGDMVPLWLSDRGAVSCQVHNTTSTAADGVSNVLSLPAGTLNSPVREAAHGWVFNGTTWDRQRGNTSGTYVQGPVAHDSAAAGNPVIVGSVARTSTPTAVTASDAVNLLLGSKGQPILGGELLNPADEVTTTEVAGLLSYGGNPRPLGIVPLVVGGANGWKYNERGNYTNLVIGQDAYTTTQTSPDQTNYNGRGVNVFVEVTSAGTGSITITIDGKSDELSAYYTMLTSAAITANGVYMFTVYPGITPVANVAVSNVLPFTFRVVATHNNANPITYGVTTCVQV